jgi:hypothetical protein
MHKVAMANPHTSLAPLGPLPEGWTRVNVEPTLLSYWVNSATRIITYYDPRNGNPHPDGFATIPVDGTPLPNGWEAVSKSTERTEDVWFLNHHTHTSTKNDPRVAE